MGVSGCGVLLMEERREREKERERKGAKEREKERERVRAWCAVSGRQGEV